MPLPPLFELHECGGNFSVYIDRVYEVFARDFLRGARPTVLGKQLIVDAAPIDGKAKRFWHMVSEGDEEEERLPALPRCARIGWVHYMIDNMQTDEFACWRHRKRIIIAHRDFSYLVVLADQPRAAILLTAYCKEYRHAREKLGRQYAEAAAGDRIA